MTMWVLAGIVTWSTGGGSHRTIDIVNPHVFADAARCLRNQIANEIRIAEEFPGRTVSLKCYEVKVVPK